jgi:hypothetical protein
MTRKELYLIFHENGEMDNAGYELVFRMVLQRDASWYIRSCRVRWKHVLHPRWAVSF